MSKQTLLLTCFLISSALGETPIGEVGSFFYQELGCKKAENGKLGYECPDFAPNNETCHFKGKVLKIGEEVDKNELLGSCNAQCLCSYEGRVSCAHYDCFQRLKPGCSQFKYSLDSCCPVDSLCGPIAECKIDGETYKEGNRVYPKNTCDVCLCEAGFKKEAPFCRRRKCYDQAYHQYEILKYGAPVFFEGDQCCPSTWTEDEGEKIIDFDKSQATSEASCKFGDRKLKLGQGFEKTVQPYGRAVPLKCKCSIPPLVICNEKK